MRLSAIPFLAAGLLWAGVASANDSMATLGAGGLVFLTSSDIEMTSEALYVSADLVTVDYTFTSSADEDRHVLVAFPMPDITGDGNFMAMIPNEAEDNIFGFETVFDGRPVEATLHQYVFAFGIEYTDHLRSLGVPLLPYGRATIEALNALDPDTQAELVRLGLVIPMEWGGMDGWHTDYTPVWTLRSTYSWEATFPAGAVVEVSHRYKPSAGGTVGVSFLGEPYDGYDPGAEYLKKYCTDDSFLRAVRRTLPDPNEPWGAPFTETRLSYIWSTGANWSGPIRRFHLTVDKGRPENLVSFCWDGEVTRTSPTTFEMEATDFYPPWNRELEILILNRNESEG